MNNERLSTVQIMTMTVGAILGVDILIVPQKLVTIVRQDAWICTAIGGLLATIIGSIIYFIATLYSDKDIPQIYLHVAGKFVGRLILLPITLSMATYAGLSIRVFTIALKMFLLDRTPVYSVVIFMTLVVIYAVYKGIYTIGAIIDIIFPLSLLTVIFIILLSIQQADISYIKPILFENTWNVFKGTFFGLQKFTGFGTVTYFLCYTQKIKGTYKWYIAALIIAIILYTVLSLIIITVFGIQDTITLIYPTLTLTKSIEFPTTFLERFEAFAAVLWIGIVFVSVVLFSFASTRNFTVLLGINEKYYKYVVLGHIPLLIFIALWEKSGMKVLEYFYLIRTGAEVISLTVIPIFAIFALLKKRKETKQ